MKAVPGGARPRTPRPLRRIAALLALGALGTVILTTAPDAGAAGVVTGTVYRDANNNGVRDNGEPGVGGIVVSGGGTSTLTNSDGAWSMTFTGTVSLRIATGWYRSQCDELDCPAGPGARSGLRRPDPADRHHGQRRHQSGRQCRHRARLAGRLPHPHRHLDRQRRRRVVTGLVHRADRRPGYRTASAPPARQPGLCDRRSAQLPGPGLQRGNDRHRRPGRLPGVASGHRLRVDGALHVARPTTRRSVRSPSAPSTPAPVACRSR